MNQSESIKELAEALSKAQGQIEGAKKDTKGNYSKYASLASVWEVCREPLSQNGLSIVQFPEGGPDQVTVLTRLFHSSGQWLESSLTLRPARADAQGMGSAITYARRYSLMAVVGVAPEDDDGQEASKPAPAPAYSKPKPVQATKPDPYLQNVGASNINTPAQQDSYKDDKKAVGERIKAKREAMELEPEKLQALIGKTISPGRMTLTELEEVEQFLIDLDTRATFGRLTPSEQELLFPTDIQNQEIA